MWGIKTPEQARKIIEEQIADAGIDEPKNLEEQALTLVGKDVYEKLIKGYTEKQWGRPCNQLPAFIIKRLPLRFVYNNNYFNDRYQGIPIGGYTKIFEKLLSGSDVILNTDYSDFIKENPTVAVKTVYTGSVDSFSDIASVLLNIEASDLKQKRSIFSIIRATPWLIIRRQTYPLQELSSTSILSSEISRKRLSRANILLNGSRATSRTIL